ncbi:MAG: hypothetical protein Q8O15_01435 [Rectinemataceae bacterium]|nr:hypothetical protein [Rectinemataceae bacterium]
MNVGGLRAMSWARRFFDRGYDVTVICGDGQEADSCDYFRENLDRTLTILKIHNPMLQDTPDQKIKRAPDPGFIDLMKERLRPYLPVLDSYVVWANAAKRVALNEAKKKGTFDAIISTSFPLSAHEVAHNVMKSLNCLWIADFRDFYGQFDSNTIDEHSFRQRFLSRWLRRCGSDINLVLSVSESLLALVEKALRLEIGTRSMVLYNGYFSEHLPMQGSKKAPEWRILYTGSYNEQEFTLLPLVQALSAWKPSFGETPEILFSGTALPVVENAFCDIGMHVRFLGSMDNREALRMQAESAFLLICDSMTGKGALLTKTFEYLAAKRPIICISRPGSELRNTLFKEAKPGYCVSIDAHEILSFIIQWKSTFGEKQIEDAFYDDALIQKFSRENQADRLVDRVEAMVAEYQSVKK